MNFFIADLSDWSERPFFGTEARATHARHASDFMGSSELPTVRTVFSAFGHPWHPGKSNTQNSWPEGASAAVISKRHLNLMG
jgi:hypothetical protein